MNADYFDWIKLATEEIRRLAETCIAIEARLAALEADKPEPLVFPAIDLGLVEGTK